MNKDFTTMKTNVGVFIQDTDATLAGYIGVWINNKYRDIISRYEWDELAYNMSLTASATVSAYKMDEDLDRIQFVLDATNDGYLEGTNRQQFYQEHYDTFDDTGTPDTYFITEDVVRAQPGSAEKITVKSSSASDTATTLLLRGITSNSVELYETITFTGATAASATNSYTRILGLSKSAATTGHITVYENDESTVLSLMAAEQKESRYRQLNIYPIPVGEVIYHIKAIRRILPLSQDNDYPVIQDIADTIELGALADAWRYKRQLAKASNYDFLYEKSIQDKIFHEVSKPDYVIQMVPTPLNRDDGIL